MKQVVIAFCLVAGLPGISHSQASGRTECPGPYLGQEPPGDSPVLFAPGIISTGYHEDGGPAFTLDWTEIYFRIAQGPYPTIFYMSEVGGVWSVPQTAPFSGKYSDGDPYITNDGLRLFFASYRPLSGDDEPRPDEDIWYLNRDGDTWGEPIRLSSPVNLDESDEWKVSLSRNGNLYFTSNRKDKAAWRIYCSKWKTDEFEEPFEFDEQINDAYHPACPCISEDESFLVFTSSKEPGRRLDLFVTFRTKDGNWSSPMNLGEPVNSSRDELYPVLSPDSRYLFFTSWRSDFPGYSTEQKSYADFVKLYNSPSNGRGGDIYWVSAKIIEELRPKE